MPLRSSRDLFTSHHNKTEDNPPLRIENITSQYVTTGCGNFTASLGDILLSEGSNTVHTFRYCTNTGGTLSTSHEGSHSGVTQDSSLLGRF